MADETELTRSGDDADRVLQRVSGSTQNLSRVAGNFASVITRAFSSSVAGGKQFDDVLKSLTLKAADLALKLAFKPIESIAPLGIGGALASIGAGVKPFANGGVIGSPAYFPLEGGGVGLAGEAGPEAIIPLRRGSDGRLGVAAGGAGSNSVVVNIATTDADSFRRSETYIAGQIARAVARGQRSL